MAKRERWVMALVILIFLGGLWVAPLVDSIRSWWSSEDGAAGAQRYYHGGLRYARQGQYDRAVGMYKKAIQVEPDFATAYDALGAAYVRQRRYTEAAESFRAAIRSTSDPPEVSPGRENMGSALNLPDVYVRLAKTYGRQGKGTEAVRTYQKALKIDPRFWKTLCGLGHIYTKHGEFERAAGAYRDAVRIDSSRVGPHYGLGLLQEKQGRYDEAIQEYREVIRLDPRHVGAHYNLGNLYLRRGSFSEGRKVLTKFKRLSEYAEEVKRLEAMMVAYPNDAMLRCQLALIYAEHGEDSLAAEQYRRATELDPGLTLLDAYSYPGEF